MKQHDKSIEQYTLHDCEEDYVYSEGPIAKVSTLWYSQFSPTLDSFNLFPLESLANAAHTDESKLDEIEKDLMLIYNFYSWCLCLLPSPSHVCDFQAQAMRLREQKQAVVICVLKIFNELQEFRPLKTLWQSVPELTGAWSGSGNLAVWSRKCSEKAALRLNDEFYLVPS